jgi:hypothetical protein
MFEYSVTPYLKVLVRSKARVRRSLCIILSLATLLTSCDCFIDHKGFVLDSATRKPIANALVRFAKREYRTDSLGFFDINYHTGFCPDWNFSIEKENYKPENILIEVDSDEVLYKVKKSSKDNGEWLEKNSLNFMVKNDTLYFLLTAVSDVGE